MADKEYSRSVLFFKRMIALTLALIILALLGSTVYFALALKRTREEMDDLLTQMTQRQEREEPSDSTEAGEAQEEETEPRPEQAKPAGEESAPEILEKARVIAHALGAADGIEGLNCLEGFLQHYEAGVRVFEADFRITSDGYAVLRHDWIGGLQDGINETAIPTRAEFLARPILGQYTPLSFRDLLLLLSQYPDVCIITDTKFTEPEAVTAQFRSMVNEAHQMGLSYLFDRIIVQIYSPAMFSVVDGVHHFPHYIYTLYQDYFGRTEDAFRNKILFCQENGILGLTMNSEIWDPNYAPIASWRGIHVFIHTVNDADEAKQLIADGVSAVYTDSLSPAELEEEEP